MSPPKYVDLVVLVAALAVFVVGDLPLVGYFAAAGAWLAARGIQFLAGRKMAVELEAGEKHRAMATLAGATLGKVWLMATVVLVVGLLAGREDGLAAAVLLATLFTTSFAAQGLVHLFEPAPKQERVS
jgi:hypothetical protein